MNYLKLVMLVIVLLNNIWSIAQNKQLDKLFDSCSKAYSAKFLPPIKKEASTTDHANNKLTSKELKGKYVWLFKSKEKISKNTWRRFSIEIYMYETPNDATSRFKEVEYTKGTVDDIFIDKGWNHLALQNKYILLITGDCSYSEDDWAKVTTTLDKELKKMFNRITRLVNCRCGGGCS